MKTIFICAESCINDHVGEEYDDIVEVPDAPTSLIIEEWASRIRNRIRKLWKEDVKSGIPKEELGIEVHLAASGVYNAMLIDFQHVMKVEEEIMLSLPYIDSAVRTTEDPETQELLDRLPK